MRVCMQPCPNETHRGFEHSDTCALAAYQGARHVEAIFWFLPEGSFLIDALAPCTACRGLAWLLHRYGNLVAYRVEL